MTIHLEKCVYVYTTKPIHIHSNTTLRRFDFQCVCICVCVYMMILIQTCVCVYVHMIIPLQVWNVSVYVYIITIMHTHSNTTLRHLDLHACHLRDEAASALAGVFVSNLFRLFCVWVCVFLLQFVAVCRSALKLQYVAVRCNIWQQLAGRDVVIIPVFVCACLLHCVAVRYAVLQCIQNAAVYSRSSRRDWMCGVRVCCCVVQCVCVCYNVSLVVAVCCI